jgi:hypothetical protein
VTAQSGGAASPFGHDDGDLQCQLYDQLAHADLAFGAAPVLAVIVPALIAALAVLWPLPKTYATGDA